MTPLILITLCVTALTALAIILSGLAVIRAPSKIYKIDSASSPTWVSVDASRRGVSVMPRPDGKGFYICAEASPDVAYNIMSTVLGQLKLDDPSLDANARLEFSQAVIELSKRSQTILFFREALYRLSEQTINQGIDQQSVVKLYEAAMEAALKLAQAELIKAQDDLLKRLDRNQGKEEIKTSVEVDDRTGLSMS